MTTYLWLLPSGYSIWGTENTKVVILTILNLPWDTTCFIVLLYKRDGLIRQASVSTCDVANRLLTGHFLSTQVKYFNY